MGTDWDITFFMYTPPVEGQILTAKLFVVSTFENCIQGVYNFVGIFEKIFWQGLWQRQPSKASLGGLEKCFECPITPISSRMQETQPCSQSLPVNKVEHLTNGMTDLGIFAFI